MQKAEFYYSFVIVLSDGTVIFSDHFESIRLYGTTTLKAIFFGKNDK